MVDVVPVRQQLVSAPLGDPAGAVRAELLRVLDRGKIAGKRIALTAGSRGISRIDEVIRAAVELVRELGGDPYLIPAMGSHGGATEAGQKEVLRHYGISSSTLGVQIRASMETVELAVAEGVPVRWSKRAWQADGVILIGRVKPHTNFSGTVESGLVKMCAVGLGKQRGAHEIHNHARRLGMERVLRIVTGEILKTGKVIAGLALLEDGYHQLSEVRGYPPERIVSGDEESLVDAKRMMPQLPFDQIDLVHVQQMGKDISGSGLDPNVIGKKPGGFRGYPLVRDHMPEIRYVVASHLTEASGGNAVGLWFCDLITQSLADDIDLEVTQMNAETSYDPGFRGTTPPVCTNDLEMLERAMNDLGVTADQVRAVFLRDTLHLDRFFVTPAMVADLARYTSCIADGDPRPAPFDEEGMLSLRWS